MENPEFERARVVLDAELSKARILRRVDREFVDEGRAIRVTLTVSVEGVRVAVSEALPYSWIDGCVNWVEVAISSLAHSIADQVL